MRKQFIYLAGVIILGLAYTFMKSFLGNPEFVIAAIIYLVVLRIGAERFGR